MCCINYVANVNHSAALDDNASEYFDAQPQTNIYDGVALIYALAKESGAIN